MKKILTVILDGFGMRNEIEGNAIKLANPVNFINLWNKYPHCLLHASGESVGLSKNQFGNSEVGHLTIGAGRLLKQNISLVDDILNNLESNNVYQEIVNNNKKVHLMYLISNGGVHSLDDHATVVLQSLKNNGISNVYFHLITDGRDTDPRSSLIFINKLKKILSDLNYGEIGSICGRYFAMDRDNNMDRTKKYFDLVTKGVGIPSIDFEQAINFMYQKNITDEFINPIFINRDAMISSYDAVMWLNFRADRAKQITKMMTDNNINVYSFLEVDKDSKVIPLLKSSEIKNTLGVYFSELGLSQARVAETEKYAHVTYFFDGGKEYDLEKCDRFLIPSPKVATYDLAPEMSAALITNRVVNCMENDYDFILVNYANPDMVGHTGNLDATIKAIDTVDNCLAKLLEVANDNFYTVVVLADHGNADIMTDDIGNPVTTHTSSMVPFIITDEKVKLKNGDLTNVAPTILKYMDIALPKEMKNSNDLFLEEVVNDDNM